MTRLRGRKGQPSPLFGDVGVSPHLSLKSGSLRWLAFAIWKELRMKLYTIIGGVDGVGKTSFLGALKGLCRDLGMVGGGEEWLEKGVSITQETTLSGFRTARKAHDLGYSVRLFYVGLDTAQESLERIQNRVRRGGHDIAHDDVLRRFEGRWEAVAKVLPYCDTAEFYDNDNGFELVAEYRNGELLQVGDRQPRWIMELREYLSHT